MNRRQLGMLAGLCALGAVFLLIGFVNNPPAEEPSEHVEQPFDEELAKAYVESACWQCHTVSTLEEELVSTFGPQAAGARTVGPDLAGVGARYHYEWHVAHFHQPDLAHAGSVMPAQRQLFDGDELSVRGDAVVRFLLTLTVSSVFNKSWPEGEHEAPDGDAVQGRELYLRECAGCHGPNADGQGEAARFFRATRKPVNLSEGEFYRVASDVPVNDSVYTTITNGLPLTGMPSFAEKLTDQERADITAYVVSIAGRQ